MTEWKVPLYKIFTDDEDVTPTISEIGVVYDGYKKTTPSEIEEQITDEQGVLTTIKNISGGDFSKLVVYTILLQ